MTSVVEIERPVERLPSNDLAAFRAWFGEFDARLFDARIGADAASGRLDRAADEALADSAEVTSASCEACREPPGLGDLRTTYPCP